MLLFVRFVLYRVSAARPAEVAFSDFTSPLYTLFLRGATPCRKQPVFLRVSQPLTLPIITPLVKYFWMNG